jgi:enoyl-CoA hydratase
MFPDPESDDPVVTTTPRRHVRLITLNRPRVLNAITAELIAAMHRDLAAAETDPDCRVVVITGAGRGFCAGLDLNGYGRPPGVGEAGETHTNLAIQRDVAGLVQRINRLPKPVIAAVNGPAAGFGFAITCASDVRIASRLASFTTSFVRIGATGCDLGVSWFLPRLIGAGRAHELMLTSRRLGADEALGIGLLADLVEADDLRERVDRAVDDLLRVPPLALELTKQGMWLSAGPVSLEYAMEMENRQQILAGATEDRIEGLHAFLEDRAPEYRFR